MAARFPAALRSRGPCGAYPARAHAIVRNPNFLCGPESAPQFLDEFESLLDDGLNPAGQAPEDTVSPSSEWLVYSLLAGAGR